MAYEAAAAVALRDHLRHGGEKGGARSHGRPKQVEEGKVVMRCGVLRIVKRILPISGESGSGKK
ncbi:hypothetical protein GQ55_6G052800 [Panicum hallii var. hallii]|uniref:Uncharacterized protein n=1 Tax=Panicum hallii var. hallii TaxID=1504633 RepID=A0A2T7D444_9POAL|nr:hypothetical protein GQ55_6G052800 [Panicum hallii var. hallii]